MIAAQGAAGRGRKSREGFLARENQGDGWMEESRVESWPR
jgi:hypothetical protein